MSLIQVDLVGWLPDSLKQQIVDSVVTFVADQAKKALGDEVSQALKRLRSDAAFQDAVDRGLKEATNRFVREYMVEDEDLVVAIARDPDFWKAESVREALLEIISHPSIHLAEERMALARNFADVLRQRVNRERVDRAVAFYLRCVAESLWHLEPLRPVYELQMQCLGVERATEMVQELHGMRADVQGAMVALVRAVGEQQKLLSTPDKLALTESKKAYHNLPQPDYGRFIGREKELAQVHSILRPYPHSQYPIVVIDGIGGIGKSALALEVAHRYLRDYDRLPSEERFEAIIWTSAKSSVLTADGIKPRLQIARTLDDIYTAIAAALEREDITRARPEDQDELVIKALTRQRTMLIVDNLETVDDERVNAFLRELPAPTKVIVTTRHRIDVAYPVRLAGMSREEGLILISQECGKKDATLTKAEAEKLYDRTGGVPLAIVWSVAQMGYGYGVEAVLRHLGTPTSDIIHYCFEGAMGRIHGTDAHKLLMALSLFATDAGREALGYMTDLSELDRDETVVELERLSLVNKKGDRFSLLPITRCFAQDLREKNQQFARDCHQRWIEYYTGFVGQRKFSDAVEQELLETERENIIEVIEQIWTGRQVQNRENLLNRFFIFLWRRGHWAEAVRQAERLLSWANDNQQTRWQARFNHWLGRLYMFQNLLDKAEIHLMLASEQYGENDWQWVSVQTYLAQIYLRRNVPQRAEQLLQSALPKALEQEGGPGRGCARIFNGFAEIRLGAGEIEEAQGYLNRALEICEEKIEHVTVLGRTYYLLAQTQSALNHLESAEVWMGKYLDLALKEGFVQEVAIAKFGLARIRHLVGKSREARRLAGEALVLFEKTGMPSELEACNHFLAEMGV